MAWTIAIVRSITAQRNQRVFVTSGTESPDDQRRVREVWSTVYHDTGTNFSALIANRLLEASADYKLGGLAKESRTPCSSLRQR
jgi:hypothetical protein